MLSIIFVLSFIFNSQKMASEELVTEQFQFLGIEITKEVLVKCVSLCEEYQVDAESFTEQWMAFSLNHLNGASPNVENLEVFARKEFSKRAASRHNAPAKETQRSGGAGAGLTVYGAPVSVKSDNEVLSNYIAATPKRVKVEIESSNQNELCPATYSPTIASAKYASRNNAGTVVHSYGDAELLKIISEPNGANSLLNVTVSQVPNDDGDVYTKSMGALRKDFEKFLLNNKGNEVPGDPQYRFGFELLHEKASIFDNHIRYVSQCIMRKAGITETTSVRHKSQTDVYVAGRIECDADARLNPKCVVLQGTWEQSLSQSVSVDIDNLKQYSLFPGQVVVMRGVNPRGDSFMAHEVYTDASMMLPDHTADLMNTLPGTVSMVVAAGPYTTSDNISYEPLKDFVSYINTHKPHIVIMTGPFMDSEHSKIKDNTMAETYKSFFDKLVDSLGELNTTCQYTKVYIVSSMKEAFHVNIYPTPPYSARRKHPNVQFIADPSTLRIGPITLGVSSTDVLMHVSQEEISLGVGSDKLSRLASHLLTQQTYYPLWPAPAPLAVDAALWAAHAPLPCTPHLLITPSNFRYFVKEVNGTVVVNPERLSKGAGGGTFARVLLSAGELVKAAVQILRV